MNFAGRINSIGFQTHETTKEIVAKYREMENITHLEFNYPEHLKGVDLDDLKNSFGRLKVNGVATRFKAPFVAGEFTNVDMKVREDAINLCKEACDACRKIGGSVLTIWQAYDGFDYPFQLNYEKAWKRQVEAFREICDYAPDLKISIEYKPFEPRSYAEIDSVGTTLLMIDEVDRPNLGMTLDFCHMLMKHDCPANGVALAASRGRLFGLHMNDGHGFMDNGLIFSTINLSQSLEFVYYLKKYDYKGVIFFDSFPVREDARTEINANIEMFNALEKAVTTYGLEKIGEVVEKQDAIECQKLILSLIRNI